MVILWYASPFMHYVLRPRDLLSIVLLTISQMFKMSHTNLTMLSALDNTVLRLSHYTTIMSILI